jgi:hypothetical protein
MSDFRLSKIKRQEERSSIQDQDDTIHGTTREDNYLSQLTENSQQMNTDYYEPISQTSSQDNSSIIPKKSIGNNLPTDQHEQGIPSNDPIESPARIKDDIVITEEIEGNMEYSFNDTPGKEISN